MVQKLKPVTPGDDFADALCRHANLLRKAILRKAHRHEELLAKELAGGHWLELGHHHHFP